MPVDTYTVLLKIAKFLENEGVAGMMTIKSNIDFERFCYCGSCIFGCTVGGLCSLKKFLPRSEDLLDAGIWVTSAAFIVGTLYGLLSLRKVEYVAVDEIMETLASNQQSAICNLTSTYIGELQFFDNTSFEEAMNSDRIKDFLCQDLRILFEEFGYVVLDKKNLNETANIQT